MTQFLIDTLGPIFYNLGVSEADLANYMGMVSGYVTVLLILFAAMIAVLVAARLAKKSLRGLIRWQAVLGFLLAAVIIVNMVSFGPLKANLSGILNASNVSVSEETANKSRELVREIGREGIVLLENNGLLPLKENVKKLNVFGWSSTNPIYGGTGSGSSATAGNVDIIKAFQNAGFETNAELTKMYTDYQAERETLGLNFTEQIWSLPEPTSEHYTSEIMNNAKAFSDTAVIVLSRSGGEGADLPLDMRAIIDGTYNIAEKVSVNPSKYGYFGGKYKNNGKTPDFDPGDTYLDLSHPEKDMIKTVCENFSNVVLVVNANNPMDLDWVADYSQIGAVLYAPGAGVTGFDALGEIIKGSVNPSGRTVDTFVKDFRKTPYINNIGNHAYSNVEDLKETIAKSDEAAQGSVTFVNYAEGIYVGYKFYETAAEEGFINYDEHVMYPFGYGLSYTTFTQEMQNFKDEQDQISFDVLVTNTGSKAGKEVVEVYFTPPYTNGGIEKSSVNLIEFAKTAVLEPGASETVSFVIPKEDMASYDSSQIKVAGGGYILETGDYVVSIRSDSHTVIDSEKFTVDRDVDYSANKRSGDLAAATNQFESYTRGEFTVLSRADGFANYEEATGVLPESAYIMSDEVRKQVEAEAFAFYDSAKFDDPSDTMPTLGAKNGLKLHDLVGAEYTDERWEKLLDQMTFEDLTTLINMGGWKTAEIKSIGKVATSDCDGPAGLNNFITQVYGTSYAAEILMAQSWNKQLLYDIGVGISNEFADVGYYGWYGPGGNTHRSPFAGRNFEYYSEDGVLAGHLAAAQVNGAATNKVYPYMKHFALNDQETNRNAFLLTFTTEQALREIYLKPFEIAVKKYEGKGMGMMSAFNFIGTVSACSNTDLLNDVLRGEWGFTGMVITDYDGSYGYMISDKSVRNGNDLNLGFGANASDVFANQSATVTKAMRQASKNILYTIVNSGVYANGDPYGKMDNMTKVFIGFNVAAGLLLIAGEVLAIRGYLKKKKEEN